ncbi:MAG TPA: PRTRC system ThiF family protein [Mucilaginibacter sp.]|jgi:PRTRC genetic system ThiF family protein|nr:PRTRC system ThiF family protein [Mucilaginibacter sp.]
MNPLTAIHITDNYLINPANPITVNLIGGGGTGSNMIMALAKMSYTLIALGHPGLHVHLYDDDRITPANLGRQGFAECELNLYKSVALINRVNRFYGTNWKAVTQKFNQRDCYEFPNKGKANIFVSCVDNIASRLEIAAILKGFSVDSRYERNRPLYWMDLGNGKFTGQAILSTIEPVKQPESLQYKTVAELPMVTDEFRELLEHGEPGDNTPSCSTAEAVAKQDLFINPALANEGASLLWQLLREGMIFDRRFFLNLREFRTQPLKITPAMAKEIKIKPNLPDHNLHNQ